MAKANDKEQSALNHSEWDVDFTSGTKTWGELDGGEKVKAVSINLAKISVILLSLYAFICSLSFLADGFRLVAGRQAGEIFQNSAIFNNPIAGSECMPCRSTRARATRQTRCFPAHDLRLRLDADGWHGVESRQCSLASS